MAVSRKADYLQATNGGTFVEQTYGGTILGNSTTNAVITKSFSLIDALEDNALSGYNTNPKEFDSGDHIYRAKKIISGGTFAYNAAKAGTWVIAKVATTLSGVAKTNLLFMGQGSLRKAIFDFQHDFGAKILTAWRANLFTWTGNLDNGSKIKSRRLWLNSSNRNASGGAALTSLATTNMYDIADGNATNKAVDSAATPTRAVPGEFVMKVDFVTKTTTGGDFFDYKPITGM